MDLSSTFMGVRLSNPLIVSSSNLTGDTARIRELADAGAGAVILKSLYEEQIVPDASRLHQQDEMYYWYPEAVETLKSFSVREGIDDYLRLIERAKAAVAIPVFASINCLSTKHLEECITRIARSGADGLEINISSLPAAADTDSNTIEKAYLQIAEEATKQRHLPVAIKMGCHFTNLQKMMTELNNTGISSLVLFNRDFRPDIDIDNMRVISSNVLSSPGEITMSLRWIALMYNKTDKELIAATGIHDAGDVVRQLLAGATSVEICSAVYRNGTGYITTMLEELQQWMRSKGYENLKGFRGLVTRNEINQFAFERVHFIKKTAGQIL